MSILVSIITVLFLTSCGGSGSATLETINSGIVHGEGEKADNRADTSIDEILKHNNVLYDEAKMLLEFSKSTAGMVEVGKHVTKFDDGSVMAKKTMIPFGAMKPLCPGERFGRQYNLPVCTGFLVAPDLLVTAGHCVNKINYYKMSWIFGYDKSKSTDSRPAFSKKYVYHTKEILEWEEDKMARRDYALVRLDRAVTVAKPLKVRSFGEASEKTEIAIIGHPNGLPTKISAGAEILEITPNAYKTNLDSFGGNSGSPVFNLYTGEVEGILISGARDYIPDVIDKCYTVNVVKDVDGAEYAAKISMVNLNKYLFRNEFLADSEFASGESNWNF